MSAGAVTKEFEARKKAEQDKALRKYGPDALLPAGRPEFDIADYAINELVGLVRYANMLEERAELMDKLFEGEDRRKNIPTIKEQRAFARELESTAADLSFRLISIRQRLKARGLHLGFTDAAA